jgi:hypothetical protein
LGRSWSSTYDQRGPDGEGVGEEGLNAMAAWRSETLEGGGVAATRSGSSLIDGSGSAKGEDGVLSRTANPASSFSTPPTSAVANWGRGNPNLLGFEPLGRGGA